MEIDGRKIGPGEMVYIVAEAGVSHCGDVSRALRLVDAAKNVGASAVKFQHWRTSRLLNPDSPMYRVLLPLELSEGQFRAIKAHADEVGITFLCTGDQAEDVDFLDSIGVPAFKVGSGNLRDIAYLQHVGTKGKPVILSTGMGTMNDVRRAVNAIASGSYGGEQIALLHCASIYPHDADGRTADPCPQNLRAIQTLAEFSYPVGLSDHSCSVEAAVAAVALGASVYEAHLALADGRPTGPDAAVSLLPTIFQRFVEAIRWTETALGDGEKRVMPEELPAREYAETWRRG